MARPAYASAYLGSLAICCLPFSTFWMYIWFSQYMLIWYADIPEETVHYIRRQPQYWMPLFILNMILNWVVPFVALLPKRTKRAGSLLAKVAAVVLLGRWLDLYWMVQPATGGPNPPLGDPRLTESLHYHN